MVSLTHRVKDTAAFVMARSQHVAIDYASITKALRHYDLNNLTALSHDPYFHYLGQGKKTLDYFLMLDLLNFGSGFRGLQRGEGGSIYYTVAKGLKDYFEQAGKFGPTMDDLDHLSIFDLANITGQAQSADGEAFSLMMKQSLVSATSFARQSGAGRLSDIFQSRAYDTDCLLDLLLKISSFKDITIYQGQPIYLLKRAQIFCQDISLCRDIMTFMPLSGLEKLTCFADNLVPAVLHHDGILRYSDSLMKKIASDSLLAGCEEEVEIRAASIVAVDAMRDAALAQGHSCLTKDLDLALWLRGQEIKKTSRLLRHYTITMMY